MHVLFLEPFCGGSHGAFLATLTRGLGERFGVTATVLTLPARHWKWRMRGAVAGFAERHDAELRARYDLVFASSFVALAELVGLYPHLGAVPRVLYFHENQLAYPTRSEFAGARDVHFGFTQMTSCLAATRCVFNSEYNRQSFLGAGARLIERMPDARPLGWADRVAARSEVLGLPMDLPRPAGPIRDDGPGAARAAGPVILWNHRWEHDKDPDAFFGALADLAAAGVPFRLAVCGARFAEVPAAMTAARAELRDRIVHWGYVADRAAYFELLGRAHLAPSTAHQEFFGLSALEATWMGARPLVPDRLAYPEWFAGEYRYGDLTAELARLCEEWVSGARQLRKDRRAIVAPHDSAVVLPRYFALFERLAAVSPQRPGSSG